MNIRSFAGPFASYMNPTLGEGTYEGASRVAYIFTSIVFDTKMMSLFSMLFGAGVIVFAAKRTSSGRPPRGLWFRRMAWLLVIGCIHAYLIWEGDILVPYALCGMLVLWWARRLPPPWLIAAGLAMVSIGVLLWALMGLGIEHAPPDVRAQQIAMFEPSPEQFQAEIETYTGSYAEIVRARAPRALAAQTTFFLIFVLWRAGGMMLIGAALMKLGFLSGALPRGRYAAIAVTGLGIGGALVVWGVVALEATGYAMPRRMRLDLYNGFGSVFMAVGYAALLIWLHKGGLLGRLGRALGAAGRMAFTNYLAQSLLCTFLFYGYGAGLFGRLDYAQQLLVVAAVWALQLAWSPWWLARFRFGPMEWAWRSLTYRRLQPMLRRAPVHQARSV